VVPAVDAQARAVNSPGRSPGLRVVGPVLWLRGFTFGGVEVVGQAVGVAAAMRAHAIGDAMVGFEDADSRAMSRHWSAVRCKAAALRATSTTFTLASASRRANSAPTPSTD